MPSVMSGVVMWTLLQTAGIALAEEAQPVPRATPVEDLLPKFSEDGAVVSHSEQFRISGGTSSVRGAAANLAEEAKQELLSLTEEDDDWEVPIKIELRGKEGEAVPLRTTVLKISFSEKGYEIRIYVNLSQGLQREEFREAVYKSLVFARGLRNREFAESEVGLRVPPWLVEGLQEANAWRLKQTDRRLYDALFQHGGLFKIQDLFELSAVEYETIDAASRAAFRVSSGALVMALLEQPEGKAGIREFLTEIPDFQGEMPALLRRHFPDLNLSENSLEKWWALQLANKGTAPLTEAFSVAKTEQMLNEALRLRTRDGDGNMEEIPFSDWSSVASLGEVKRMEAVKQAEADLLRLSYRCFPSYRVLLLEYQALLKDFSNGNTENLQVSVNTLATTRATMLEKAQRARDFLDWFEITRARETSGVFDDYLNLKARLKENPTRRKDDLSKYLDRLDPLFAMPEEQKDEFGLNPQFLPF